MRPQSSTTGPNGILGLFAEELPEPVIPEPADA